TLNKALELAPREAGLWYEIGLVQSRRQNYDNSLGSLRKAVELAPDNRMFQTTVGFTLARAGKVDEAIAVLSDVLGEARAYFDLARLMRHMGQADRARELAQAAQARDPKLPGLQEFLAGKSSSEQPADPSQPSRVEPVKVVPKLVSPTSGSGTTGSAPSGLPVIIQGTSGESASSETRK
ncbi:MAG: tetratricopeptide repeat protein, partial [Gemmataceae bacterium]